MVRPLLAQTSLHSFEQFAIQQRRLSTGTDLPFVENLTDVEAVAENVEQGTGVDLGPNLSVTGSLAAILWLIALRREGEGVSALRFFKLGLTIMPPALLLTALSAVSR